MNSRRHFCSVALQSMAGTAVWGALNGVARGQTYPVPNPPSQSLTPIDVPRTYYGALGLSDKQDQIPAYVVGFKMMNPGKPAIRIVTSWDGETSQAPVKPNRLIVFDGELTSATPPSGKARQMPPILFDEPHAPATIVNSQEWPVIHPTSQMLTILPLHHDGNTGPWVSSKHVGSSLQGQWSRTQPQYWRELFLGYMDQGGGGGNNFRKSLNVSLTGDSVGFYVPTTIAGRKDSHPESKRQNMK